MPIILYQIPGRIYLVLELCRGGDLSLYIQSHGRVSEATAMYFMKQLGIVVSLLENCYVLHSLMVFLVALLQKCG